MDSIPDFLLHVHFLFWRCKAWGLYREILWTGERYIYAALKRGCRECGKEKINMADNAFFVQLFYCVDFMFWCSVYTCSITRRMKKTSGNRCRYVALCGSLGRQAIARAPKPQNKPWMRFSRQNIQDLGVSDGERALGWRLFFLEAWPMYGDHNTPKTCHLKRIY